MKWEYFFFKNIKNVYEYIYIVNKKLFKKFLLNKYKYKVPAWYLWNANISILSKHMKHYRLLAKIRRIFVKKPLLAIILNTNPNMPIVNKHRFWKFFVSWYMSINRKEPIAYNLNNLTVYYDELKFFIKNLAKYNLIFYKKFNKIIVWINHNIKKRNFRFSNLIKSIFKLKKNKQIYKYLKQFFQYNKKLNINFLKKLSKVLNFINNFFKFNNFYLNYFNKFINIYNKFLNIKNILNIKYNSFSFYCKKKKVKKINYYAVKKTNIIYYINNIIHQFLFYIFIYWLNLYINNINYNNNLTFFKNSNNSNNFISINIYKHYFERKYKRKFRKLNFLKPLKNNMFLLYYKNIFIL